MHSPQIVVQSGHVFIGKVFCVKPLLV